MLENIFVTTVGFSELHLNVGMYLLRKNGHGSISGMTEWCTSREVMVGNCFGQR